MTYYKLYYLKNRDKILKKTKIYQHKNKARISRRNKEKLQDPKFRKEYNRKQKEKRLSDPNWNKKRNEHRKKLLSNPYNRELLNKKERELFRREIEILPDYYIRDKIRIHFKRDPSIVITKEMIDSYREKLLAFRKKNEEAIPHRKGFATCSKCGFYGNYKHFKDTTEVKNGYKFSVCKVCHRARLKQRRKDDPIWAKNYYKKTYEYEHSTPERREKLNNRFKAWSQIERKEVKDSYVISILSQNYDLKRSDIPVELIKAKKSLIKANRVVKKLSNNKIIKNETFNE